MPFWGLFLWGCHVVRLWLLWTYDMRSYSRTTWGCIVVRHDFRQTSRAPFLVGFYSKTECAVNIYEQLWTWYERTITCHIKANNIHIHPNLLYSWLDLSELRCKKFSLTSCGLFGCDGSVWLRSWEVYLPKLRFCLSKTIDCLTETGSQSQGAATEIVSPPPSHV